MDRSKFIICVVLVFSLRIGGDRSVEAQSSQNNNECFTPNDLNGNCINIKRCPKLRSLLETQRQNASIATFLRNSMCGYEGKDPKVCCPLENEPNTYTETSQRITTQKPDSTGSAVYETVTSIKLPSQKPPVTSIPVVEGNEELRKPQNLIPPFSKVVSHFGISGISVALATGVTHPLDVVKVRLQMQHVGQRGPLIGMTGIFLQLMKNEGRRSLYLGLTPALTRSVLYGGLRLGLYEPTKVSFDWAFGSTNVLVKIASGAFAGAFSTALTNPVEVVKVRLQMNPNAVPIAEVREIVSKEGIGALWKGVGPAMVRAAALTASQLATYDEAKRILVKRTSLEEGFHLHLCSSVVAGLVSTLITAPMDMIKTRLMLQQGSESTKTYRNGFHCGYKVVRKEGPLALYKG